MITAGELDGHTDLTSYVGQKVDHAVGIGTLIEIGDINRSGPKQFRILIDLKCDFADGCEKTFAVHLRDGPSQGDWAYATEVETGDQGDLRNQNIYCDQHQTLIIGE